jgi:hypothetical protein
MREAREERSRRCRCAAARFDAANEPRAILGEVVCGAPTATAVVVPGLLAQSSHLESEAVREANEAAGPSVLPESLAPLSDFLEAGGGDIKIERGV